MMMIQNRCFILGGGTHPFILFWSHDSNCQADNHFQSRHM